MDKEEIISIGVNDVVGIILKHLRDSCRAAADSDEVDLNRDTPLLGPGGRLDSLGLVSLIVSVEQALEDVNGISVSLADERAMSQASSPYRTVGSLAEYATRVLKQRQPDA